MLNVLLSYACYRQMPDYDFGKIGKILVRFWINSIRSLQITL